MSRVVRRTARIVFALRVRPPTPRIDRGGRPAVGTLRARRGQTAGGAAPARKPKPALGAQPELSVVTAEWPEPGTTSCRPPG